MLADPRRCPCCVEQQNRRLHEAGEWWRGVFRCTNCGNSGVVCNLCSKPEGECECSGVAATQKENHE